MILSNKKSKMGNKYKSKYSITNNNFCYTKKTINRIFNENVLKFLPSLKLVNFYCKYVSL